MSYRHVNASPLPRRSGLSDRADGRTRRDADDTVIVRGHAYRIRERGIPSPVPRAVTSSSTTSFRPPAPVHLAARNKTGEHTILKS